jgi:hypothetical protein
MSEYVELYIDQGADFSTTITIEDDTTNLAQNLSGYVVTSSLRKSLLSVNASANMVCSLSDATNGVITMSMTGANTANLKLGSYFFDVVTVNTLNSNARSRLIEGVIFVIPSITR